MYEGQTEWVGERDRKEGAEKKSSISLGHKQECYIMEL